MDSLLAPIITAIVAAISAAYLLREQRRKLGAEADSLTVTAAAKVIQGLQSEVERLSTKFEELESEHQTLSANYELLSRQLQEAQRQLRDAQAENIALRAENDQWRERVRVLEAELARLRQRIEPAEDGDA